MSDWKEIRASGVLLPVSALPSPYGIGTFGREAYSFVNFLSEAGQSYWQILPLGITSYGDSPYQSPSAFAGGYYYIDLDLLVEEGFLLTEDLEGIDLKGDGDVLDPGSPIDYYQLYLTRLTILRRAFARSFERLRNLVQAFSEAEAWWLSDFAVFMAIKSEHEMRSWQEWPDPYRFREPKVMEAFTREHEEELKFWYFVQYLFFRQWAALKQYAHGKGVRIIGDIPIYVAEDSADVWANPKLFRLDENLIPVTMAGCPPDYFSETGQLWGNPIYNWKAMKEEGYHWWIQRMAMSARIFDVIRIDHFRGFEAYWEIPYGDPTAQFGEWVKGPGLPLFSAIEDALGKLPIIAEDLGLLTEEFHQFHRATGFPGMKVLVAAFDDRDVCGSLPYNYHKNEVVYTSTHDNNPVRGWWENEAKAEAKEMATDYLRLATEERVVDGFLRATWSAVPFLAVAAMQDLLDLGTEARINLPATLGGNWQWRMKPDACTQELAEKLLRLTKVYGRYQPIT